MDRGERLDDLNETLIAALTGWQADMWTALPGIIQSFDPVAMTVTVQPSIQAQVSDPKTGAKVWTNLPLLLDVPVEFPSGGGYTLTFPIAPGDECRVVFSSRCIDSWWQAGGIQAQHQLRMHDLSDGFAFVGIRSQPRIIPNVKTDSTQFRNDAGTTYVELKGTTVNIITPGITNITTGGNTNITSSATCNVKATGAVNVEAGTVATIKAPSIILKNAGAALKALCTSTFMTLFNQHTHDVTAVGSPTGVPNQQGSAGTHTTTIVQGE